MPDFSNLSDTEIVQHLKDLHEEIWKRWCEFYKGKRPTAVGYNGGPGGVTAALPDFGVLHPLELDQRTAIKDKRIQVSTNGYEIQHNTNEIGQLTPGRQYFLCGYVLTVDKEREDH